MFGVAWVDHALFFALCSHAYIESVPKSDEDHSANCCARFLPRSFQHSGCFHFPFSLASLYTRKSRNTMKTSAFVKALMLAGLAAAQIDASGNGDSGVAKVSPSRLCTEHQHAHKMLTPHSARKSPTSPRVPRSTSPTKRSPARVTRATCVASTSARTSPSSPTSSPAGART